jgi:hypothetical protein
LANCGARAVDEALLRYIKATRDLLRELGADYAQRFHVGRPVPLSRAQSSM